MTDTPTPIAVLIKAVADSAGVSSQQAENIMRALALVRGWDSYQQFRTWAIDYGQQKSVTKPAKTAARAIAGAQNSQATNKAA